MTFYVPGMPGKIGLQEIEGCFFVKLPKQYRMAPPGVLGNSYLRSTWFRKYGTWQCVESLQGPSASQPINEWVERVLFQFHPLPDAVPAPPNTPDGILILSIAHMIAHNHNKTDVQTVHSLQTRPLQLTNALTRIVHGGRGD